VAGELHHASLQPLEPSLLAPDAMGWMAYLPDWALPCRHGVVSFGHRVTGSIAVDGGEAEAVHGWGCLPLCSTVAIDSCTAEPPTPNTKPPSQHSGLAAHGHSDLPLRVRVEIMGP
jgi:hypothetical protein